MFEYPPILTGSEQQQLAALRDYLVRMARSLQQAQEAVHNTEADASAETAALAAARSAALSGPRTAAPTPLSEVEQVRRNAAELRALIIKTAGRLDGQINTVQQNVDRVDATLREDYLALSDFGAYTEQAAMSMTATAKSVVESYDYAEQIQAVGASLDALDSYLTTIRGEIRRGLITDPETGEQVLGIAIAENLRFTGQVHTADGLTYYELSPGQTLGLYTATGWQFWINGAKRGWFDSTDGMLHVTNLVSENSFRLSDKWVITNSGGLGIKYTGG